MRTAARRVTIAAVTVLVASAALAQAPATSPIAPPKAFGAVETPTEVAGYVVTVTLEALAKELRPTGATAPEAQAMLGTLKAPTAVRSTFYFAQDLSRQEILSSDFVLPAGTVLLHRAGDRAYVVADPPTRTYAVMDAATLLAALEGGAGIENSAYTAKVFHTDEKKTIAGLTARKSILTVNYVTAMPLENDKVLIQQQNEIEIWHTSGLSSAAAMDHLFFKFQRDKTGEVRRTVAQEIGFPLEVKMVVTQAGTGPKAGTVQPGSLHAQVTELKKEAKIASALFSIPPAGYRRVERLPFFGNAKRP